MNVFFRSKPMTLPTASEALPGRTVEMPVADTHVVLGTPMKGPWPGMEEIVVAMGCFWGAERRYWQAEGVVCTAVGYAGGHTPNPTYEEACSGRTGHTEVVRVIFDPTKTSLAKLLKLFWESHDPTQGMRQGNDTGTQYRSALYVAQSQLAEVQSSAKAYGAKLKAAGFGPITTEIRLAPTFYYAEDFHQQYLSDLKNPNGYCGLSGTGVSCPIGLGVDEG